MTLALRIILIAVSLITLFFITNRIRNSKIRLEDSILWFCLMGLLFVCSIFPGVFDTMAQLAGVYATSNFVFLFFIFVLLIICFNLSMRVSQADTKIKELTQQLAIEKFERHKVGKSVDENR